jgi:hypothetical protein
VFIFYLHCCFHRRRRHVSRRRYFHRYFRHRYASLRSKEENMMGYLVVECYTKEYFVMELLWCAPAVDL